jgi:hypothetical protein
MRAFFYSMDTKKEKTCDGLLFIIEDNFPISLVRL